RRPLGGARLCFPPGHPGRVSKTPNPTPKMHSARILRAGLLVAVLGCLAASRLLALGTPVLTKPAHASTGHVPHPSYFWNAVPGAASYRCEVATDAAFTQIVSVREGITVPRHVPLGALPPGTYHWRVTAQ